MNEKPILFSGEMVRAILSGRKTETRRLIKHIPMLGYPSDWCDRIGTQEFERIVGDYRRSCPYGVPGDRLWVRETWALAHMSVDCEGVCDDVEEFIGRPTAADCDGYWRPIYAADADDIGNHSDDRMVRRYRPSIHMPRWASRINLTVEGVRVERLQDIGEAGAIAEGVEASGRGSARFMFTNLWDAINGKRAPWESNPWVWVVSFKVEVPHA